MELNNIFEELYELEGNESINEHGGDIDNRKREYRRKFDKLLKMLGLDNKYYKENKGYTIPDSDAHIIKAILKLGTTKNTLTAKWLNGNSNNKFSSEDIVSLYENIETEIRECTNTPKHGINVHVDEWLDTLDSVLNYSCSKMIVEMKRLLEELKIVTLPLNHKIDVGTMYIIDEYGNKEYINFEKQQEFKRTFGYDEKEINASNFEDFSSAQEYLQALNKLLYSFIKDAEGKAHYNIETIAMMKDAFEADCTVDDYIDSYSKEMVSSYIARDRNIYKYLIERPNAKKHLEDKTKLMDIDKYFDI